MLHCRACYCKGTEARIQGRPLEILRDLWLQDQFTHALLDISNTNLCREVYQKGRIYPKDKGCPREFNSRSCSGASQEGSQNLGYRTSSLHLSSHPLSTDQHTWMTVAARRDNAPLRTAFCWMVASFEPRTPVAPSSPPRWTEVDTWPTQGQSDSSWGISDQGWLVLVGFLLCNTVLIIVIFTLSDCGDISKKKPYQVLSTQY